MSNDLDRTPDRSAADPDTLCKCRVNWEYRCGACMWPALPRDCEGNGEEQKDVYGLQAILAAIARR